MDKPLATTLSDIVDFLRREKVPYVLVGGLATSLRGQPRVTADVDMIILGDVERALSLVDGLQESRFAPLFDDVADVVRNAFLLPIRHRATGVKVDLAIGLSGFEQQVVGRAEVLDLAGTSICVATAEDLLLMKVLAGRPRDEQDVRGLLDVQGDRIDWDYCVRLADDLGEAIGQDLGRQVRVLRGKMASDE